MCRLLWGLLACVPVLASTVSVSATCDGISNQAVYSTACQISTGTYAAAQVLVNSGFPTVTALAVNVPSETSAASAFFSANYNVTVTGGTGSGFAAPGLSVDAQGDGAQAVASAAGSWTWGTGGCIASNPGHGLGSDSCQSALMPFVFGTSQMVNLEVSATANAFASYPIFEVGGVAGTAPWTFFDVNGQLLADARVTIALAEPLPSAVPEGSTFPILLALASAALTRLGGRRIA